MASPPRRTAGGRSAAPPRFTSGLQRRPVVQLAHAQRAGWGGLHAELAEDALVEVLLHDLYASLGRGVDVHRAGILELLRHLRVPADRVVDLDVDELAGHQAATFPIFSRIRSGISEI